MDLCQRHFRLPSTAGAHDANDGPVQVVSMPQHPHLGNKYVIGVKTNGKRLTCMCCVEKPSELPQDAVDHEPQGLVE